MSSSTQWLERYDSSLMGVFGTPQQVLVQGSGCYVQDANGKQYLDLLAGIAVNALGHAHPALVSAVSDQLGTLGHVSNFFSSPPQILLAERLLTLAGAPEGSKVFFANSGTEANEAAFKLARRNTDPATGRTRILALEGAFHGRTMGALALTAKQAYREPFEPLPGGVEHLPFGDIQALQNAVDPTVAAVFLEPIQGEAGVRMLPEGYLAAAREATRAAGALLIIDEVQTGIGRTGSLFCYQQYGILPDAVTFAKGIAGGLPMAGVLCNEKCRNVLTPGTHATTFGGNPVAAAGALAVLDVLDEAMLEQVNARGAWLREQIAAFGSDYVDTVRGMGLMVGIVLRDGVDRAALVKACYERNLLVLTAGPKTIRLLPPLVISQEELERGLSVLKEVLC